MILHYNAYMKIQTYEQSIQKKKKKKKMKLCFIKKSDKQWYKRLIKYELLEINQLHFSSI